MGTKSAWRFYSIDARKSPRSQGFGVWAKLKDGCGRCRALRCACTLQPRGADCLAVRHRGGKMTGPFALNHGTTGMPQELVDVVDKCSERTQLQIFVGWQAIGEEGREGYRRFIAEAWTRRGRRKRGMLAAAWLTDPTTGFGIGYRP